MNDTKSPEDLPEALARTREIENSLLKMDNDPNHLASDAQAQLMDELMMLDMGMQPLRRAMSRKTSHDADDQPSEKSS